MFLQACRFLRSVLQEEVLDGSESFKESTLSSPEAPTLSQVVLVDNSPTSLAMQPDNGIPVSTWRDDPQDREMMELLTVLHSLRQMNADVPGILQVV